MERYRVLVVDDSAFMRKIITDLIENDPQFTVVATGSNGIEAVTLVEKHQPDIITLDLEMPMMNGLDALQHILKKHKIPIIMLSGISEANTRDTIKALQYGAFDFIRKPTGVGANAQDIHTVGEWLLEKLRIASLTKRITFSSTKITSESKIEIDNKIKDNPLKQAPNLSKNDNMISNKKHGSKLLVVTDSLQRNEEDKADRKDKIIENKKSIKKEIVNKDHSSKPSDESKLKITKGFTLDSSHSKKNSTSKIIHSIIAIGTSTGGPRALHEVICNLPGDLQAPVVIVQHMPPRFTKSLAQRLDHFSELDVCEAEHGMRLENGKVYVAPGGFHMTVVMQQGQFSIVLNSDQPRNGHRPSVDVLFESLLEFEDLNRHIVLMTGMGSDGAVGMKKLYDQGVTSSIAEAEESCVVYGMPRSAVELGAASKILPLTNIAPELIKLLSNHK